MTWRAEAHKGFLRDLERLGPGAEGRIRTGVRRLVDALIALGHPESRRTFTSGTIVPGVDLIALRASGIPGSYRLRIGPFRVALTVLPDEALVLLTVAARRDETTYRGLPALHRKRFHDR